jgi:hypothetical protein
MNHTSLSHAIVPFAFGILFAGFGLWTMVNRSRFRSRAIVTAGTIVGHQVASRGEDGTMYYTIVEFMVQDGTVTRGRTRMATSPAAGRVGSAATVYYNPANPAKIDIATRRTPVLTIMTGVIPLLVGLALLIAGLLTLTGQIGMAPESAPDLVELERWRSFI